MDVFFLIFDNLFFSNLIFFFIIFNQIFLKFPLLYYYVLLDKSPFKFKIFIFRILMVKSLMTFKSIFSKRLIISTTKNYASFAYLIKNDVVIISKRWKNVSNIVVLIRFIDFVLFIVKSTTNAKWWIFFLYNLDIILIWFKFRFSKKLQI